MYASHVSVYDFSTFEKNYQMSYILHKGKGQHLFWGSVWKNTIDNNVSTVTPEANNFKTFPEALRPSTEKKGNLI